MSNALRMPVVLGLASLMLVACASKTPAPNWALEAQSASERAVQAYLKGQSRVADVEWSKAFNEVAATGLPSQMARMALLQCAAQTAALELTDCPRFQRYGAGAEPAEQAYARYLQGAHTAADVPLLPQAQQAMATQLLTATQAGVGLPAAAQALSQLTAAGVALRAGAITKAQVQQAVDVASQQGWRRAVMAWLLVERRGAQDAGDAAALQILDLRLQVLQEGLRKDELKNDMKSELKK